MDLLFLFFFTFKIKFHLLTFLNSDSVPPGEQRHISLLLDPTVQKNKQNLKLKMSSGFFLTRHCILGTCIYTVFPSKEPRHLQVNSSSRCTLAYGSEWFEPRSINTCSSYCGNIRMRVVLKRTVVGD